MSNRTVLLTGGSGLLALNWAMACRAERQVVLAMHERRITLAGVDARPALLTTVDQVRAVLDDVRPGLMVHTAGLTNIERCEEEPALARQINTDLAATVAEACASRQVPLVHISTDHLFAGDTSMAIETDPPAPLNVYAQTKAVAETRVAEAWPRALIVRTNFYGWGPTYRRSFSDVVLASLRAGQPMSLFTDVYYTPILAGAVATTCHALVDAGASGVFNVAGEDRLSKYDFGCRLAAQFGLDVSLLRPGSITDLPALAPRPRDMSLSTDAVRAALGHGPGGVDAHLTLLRQQEESGHARELQNL